ncbi:hypothetical protein QWY31_03945 [Cytophagales bacterium LB-30]|uniref:Rieske domain-containing protein n=1 Tax=Shiella aurantiaca TaxID=3058365 RepID=A0ABT8F2Y9_9BACT|nr:hypothetical protein [Shiella aurantiaca]MDN4164639.1 hypothetical protein [Shiella aurantiaca]
MKNKVYWFIFFPFFFSSACDSDPVRDTLPLVYVAIDLNVRDLRYNDLHTLGYVYLEGGLRGIILYKKSETEYLAFERNCTYDSSNPCGIVEMDASVFFMKDPCCESTFNLEGIPSGGPAQNPLRTYFTFLEGDRLFIRSETF